MQGVMWLILGGSVGLAALVNHRIRESMHIELGEEIPYGNLIVRLPVGWKVQSGEAASSSSSAAAAGATTAAGESLLVRAVEATAMPRSLSIERHRLGALISPEEFLFQDPMLPAVAAQQMLNLAPAELADHPAILIAAQLYGAAGREDGGAPGPGAAPAPAAAREPRKLLRICTVLPSRDAILVQVDGPGTLSDADFALARQVAGAVQITGEPWLEESTRTVELSDGTIVGVPEGFGAVANNDPNRIARSLLRAARDGSWACAELVPCLYADDAGDPIDVIRTMMLPHGEEWREARVTRESPSQAIWRIDPRGQPDFPRRAYLLAGIQPGRALLVVFRAGLGNAPLIEPAWKEIRRTVRFTSSIDLTPLLQTGAEQARRLRGLGLADLILSRNEQWWLWYKDSADAFIGFSHVEYDPGDKWRATCESSWNMPDGSSADLLHRFDSDASMQGYDSLLQRFDKDVRYGHSVVKVFERALHADQGQIRVLMERGRSNWQGMQPPQFVPGGWLGELMTQFRDRSAILRTDALVGCEAYAPAAPMMVWVRPTRPEELPPQERDRWPWCLTVQVNGADQVMRWHFSADGFLQQIDLADGVHRIRSDRPTIESFTEARNRPIEAAP